MPEFTQRHEEDLRKVYTDMYLGNGKPALTIRMEVAEERQDTFETNVMGHIAGVKQDLQAIKTYVGRALLGVLLMLGGGIITFIFTRH